MVAAEKRGRVTRQKITADKDSWKGKSARARSLSIGAGGRGGIRRIDTVDRDLVKNSINHSNMWLFTGQRLVAHMKAR